MISRRDFLKFSAVLGGGALLAQKLSFVQRAFAAYVANATLDPTSIDQFVAQMVIPPAMPRSGKVKVKRGKNIDYYEIAVRQFGQQILPAPYGLTTVWSYGSLAAPGTVGQGGSFNYPAFTIESKWKKPARVKWVNDLVDANGNPLPHLLPVDPTLHWANPIGMRDMRPNSDDDPNYWSNTYLGGQNGSYTGPVPMVTHVHGAHTTQDSDGYPEAWYLPAGATGVNWNVGTFYDDFAAEFAARYPGYAWGPGFAYFEYPNDMRATTLWYHDHTLGMTRLNVYAGPAGFYIIRGGPDDMVTDLAGLPAVLPGPAPALGDLPGMIYYEIPIVIQDRSFDQNGQLWYPYYRAFFEGLGDVPDDLKIPFTYDELTENWGYALNGNLSDVAAIWQPEFFGNVMVVNGVSWPFQKVEPQLYRFRLLNGCNSRFLILGFSTDGTTVDPNIRVFQIGAEGGFLPAPVDIGANSPYPGMLLMSPAERADVIVDFSSLAAGSQVMLLNFGPDEPFGGGVIGDAFPAADPATTGQVMRFDVVAPGPMSIPLGAFTDPANLALPLITPLTPTAVPRHVSLNEEESAQVSVPVNPVSGDFVFDTNGTLWEVPAGAVAEGSGPYTYSGLPGITWDTYWEAGPFGPTSALLGTYDPLTGIRTPMLWMAPVTESPALGSTEVWEMHNFTMDAHPIHIHLVQFQVVNREVVDTALSPHGDLGAGAIIPIEPAETGFKDTVIAYPGETTRVIARFDIAGRFVWHCHIVEHEDNEMMRPYDVV